MCVCVCACVCACVRACVCVCVCVCVQNEQFQLTAMAKDAGDPPRNSTVRVVVNVKSGSSKPPTWDQDYNSRTYTVGRRQSGPMNE